MALYASIFLFLSAIGFGLKPRSQRGLVILVLLGLFWFMGWRYYVGCDFTGYLNRYNAVVSGADPWQFLIQNEGFFLFLTVWLKVNEYPYVWLNIVASALILIGYYRYFKVSREPIAELALLFPIIILQLSMSGLRQGVAVALLTAACAEFLKGRRVATAAWIILASQFHTSVAIFLPMAFLAGRTVSFSRLLAGGILLTPLAAFLIGEQAQEYTNQYVLQIYGEAESGGAVFRYILVFLPAAYFWMYRKRFAQVMPKRYALFQIFALATILIAPLFLISSLIVHRLTFYLMPVSIMIAASAYLVPPPKIGKGLIKIAPFALYGVYMIGWLAFSRHASLCYIPYQSYSFQ